MLHLSENTIRSPFRRDDTVLLPAGTPVRSTNPRHREGRVLSRAQRVRVNSVFDGSIDVWNDDGHGRGYVRLPILTFLGSGSYYQDVYVTPELCALNHVAVPSLPDTSEIRDSLDVEPSYGPGYDNRDRVRPRALHGA